MIFRNHKRYALVVMMIGFCSFVHGLTYNHLRILDLLELNKNKIMAEFESGDVFFPGFSDCFRGLSGVESLEDFVSSLHKLRRERDEAFYFIQQLSRVAKEEQDDLMPFALRDPQYFEEERKELEDKLLSRYDQSFKRLADILGVGDVRDIAGAMLQLKQEWLTARKWLKEVITCAQEHEKCAACDSIGSTIMENMAA